MTRNKTHLHATIRGKVHVRENRICEDASGSMEIPEVDGFAFVVADGHGDNACSRSAIGSQVAVDTALECLRDVAHQVGRFGPDEVDTDAIGSHIVHVWRRGVLTDLKENTLSKDEWEQLGERGQRIAEVRPEHLYGTTLVAGLLLPHMLVLVQQGDGSCVVLDERGEFVCPMPEDDKCVGNVTSSMCDKDAAEHIRCLAIGTEQMRPIACFVGTDGIDKSLAGPEGLFDCCAELLLELQKRDDAETLLGQWIGDLSAEGSGDDASLAVYVDMDAVRNVTPRLKDRMAVRKQGEELALLQDKAISMQRRSEYYMRTEPASEDERIEREQYLAEYRACLERIQELEEMNDMGDAEREPIEQAPIDSQSSSVAEPDLADELAREPEDVPNARPEVASTVRIRPSVDAHPNRLSVLHENELRTKGRADQQARVSPPHAEAREAKGGNRRSILLLVSISMSVLALLAVIALCLVLFSRGAVQEEPVPPADGSVQEAPATAQNSTAQPQDATSAFEDSTAQPQDATSAFEDSTAQPQDVPSVSADGTTRTTPVESTETGGPVLVNTSVQGEVTSTAEQGYETPLRPDADQGAERQETVR